MISHLLSPILGLSGLVAYLLVGALAFGEAAVLLGFVLPGETAVILGGVLASQGNVSLPIMVVVACVAAVVGDSVGYEVGRIFGPRILDLRPLRRHRNGIDSARALLHRWGGWAVFIGRFTAFLRAVVPGLSGMAGMPYPKFLLANATGGIIWAVGYTLLGYFVGSAYKRVETLSGWASGALLGLIVVALLALAVRRHYREKRLESQPLRPEDPQEATAPGPAD